MSNINTIIWKWCLHSRTLTLERRFFHHQLWIVSGGASISNTTGTYLRYWTTVPRSAQTYLSKGAYARSTALWVLQMQEIYSTQRSFLWSNNLRIATSVVQANVPSTLFYSGHLLFTYRYLYKRPRRDNEVVRPPSYVRVLVFVRQSGQSVVSHSEHEPSLYFAFIILCCRAHHSLKLAPNERAQILTLRLSVLFLTRHFHIFSVQIMSSWWESALWSAELDH